MNVAYVVHHSPQAVGYESADEFLGRATYHRTYCDLLAEAGHDVELVYLTHGSKTRTPEENFERVGLPVTYGDEFGKEYSLTLVGYLLAGDFDVIHLQGYRTRNIPSIVQPLRVKDARVFAHHHGPGYDTSNAGVRRKYVLLKHLVLNGVDKVISVNQKELRNLREFGADEEKLVHLPNGIDPEKFGPMDPADCRAELGLSEDGRYLLFVGRITEYKGAEYLVEAFSRMTETHPDLELLLVYGSAEDEAMATVERIVDENDLASKVHFVGAVERENLPTYYNAADACAFPSKVDGFPLVTLEAMSCRTPLVGTTAHEDAGHLFHERNALLAEVESAESLVENVTRLLDDGDLRERIRENAYQSVRENYTWDAIGRRLAAIYADEEPEERPEEPPMAPTD